MTYLVFLAIILLLIFFIAGCFAGAWFRRSRGDMAVPTASKATTAPLAEPVKPAERAAAPAPAPVTRQVSPAPPETPKAEPAAPVAEVAASEPAPPVPGHPAPKVDGADEASLAAADAAGKRPAGITEPRGGTADKLTRVKGIGPVNEKRLHSLGVFHFDQIAAWGEQEIAWVDTFLTFKGRIERENWVGQASELARDT